MNPAPSARPAAAFREPLLRMSGNADFLPCGPVVGVLSDVENALRHLSVFADADDPFELTLDNIDLIMGQIIDPLSSKT